MRKDVCVYQIFRSEGAFDSCVIHLDWLARVTLETSDDHFEPYEELAARAWIECVGREREAKLIDLNVPDVIIQYQRNIGAVANDLAPAPAGFEAMGIGFLLDDQCTTWLINVECGDEAAPLGRTEIACKLHPRRSLFRTTILDSTTALRMSIQNPPMN